MKKQALIGFVVLLMGNLAWAGGFWVGVKGSLFSSENPTFRDVYGGGVKFGLEGGLEVAKNLSVWAGLDYLHKTGKLTLTEEETKVTITPIGAGVRYEFPAGGILQFHVKAGIQEVLFKEENVLGTASESGLGIIAGGGGVFRLTDKIGLGLFVSWSTCKMTHEGEEFKVGGLEAGGGIEFRF